MRLLSKNTVKSTRQSITGKEVIRDQGHEMKIENGFGPIDIAVSGLRAQNKQMEVISSNIANARTTDAGKGEPYRRLEAISRHKRMESAASSFDR